MCLIKVRTGASNLDLAERFNVSEGTVSSIMLIWINYLYLVLGSVRYGHIVTSYYAISQRSSSLNIVTV